MSRRIAIVGAGQSGALLALALRRDGYDVTLATDRSANDIRTGPVLSSQCMFSSALAIESDLGLDHWPGDVPAINRMAIRVAPTGGGTPSPAVSLVGKLDEHAASLDQRLKCARWIDDFTELGGTLRLGEVGTAELEELSETHDLTIAASGKGTLAQLFSVDGNRTVYDAPQRVSTLVYVSGMDVEETAELTMTVVPGVGECLTMPALTVSGTCQIILIEAVPGGPLDPASELSTAAARLDYVTNALTEHFPDIAAQAADIALTDLNATLHGAVTPTVRHPVAQLCNGRRVLGMADVVVLNDPITGQGSNNAVHSAHTYHQAILARGDRPFDAAWMNRTFEKYWRGWGQWSVAWTNSVLGGIPDHIAAVFGNASELSTVADAVVRGFDDPRTVQGWWFSADEAQRLVETARREAKSVLNQRELRRALGQYVTGVTVITAKSPEGRKIGLTANSFTSVSLDPPLVSFCPARTAPSLADLTAAGRFAVNILAADQHDLSRQFATPSDDKFAGVEHRDGVGGTPLLDRVVAQFQCRTVARVDAGDHVIFLGEIEEFPAPGGDPLVFHSGGYRLVATHP
ncbi:flavin reductase, partial [Gordonia sp. i37]|uniref:flavin reductase n=1 Tax=Gordonia sp. i37 TaxID=1961707 RepID=UPI0009AE1E67